ncbi:lysine--tRNA ligase [Candidatus Woesearchaeota archaeon]|nr:lysine--tRNA ligase [Candidatus Woesearchaeota archaeon]
MGEAELINERLRKLEEIKQLGINPYPYSFDVKNTAKELKEKYAKLKEEEQTKDTAVVAGRIMALRRMGKASFVSLQDMTERIQLYFKQDDVGEKLYKLLKLSDIGDIIGVEGDIFKTRTGEVTIYVKKFEMLCKSIRPLPEKFHGLKDAELRYRQRYVDLIMNTDVKKTFILRTKIIDAMREFLNSKGFIEVEVPTLQSIYGGANAKPFMTFHNELKQNMFLSISPELFLKRCVVGGIDKVYTICKNFRNEGIDTTHNPEFTTMESYEAYADYNDTMKLTEEMVEFICKKVLGKTKVKYGDKEIDFKVPWQRMSMKDAIKKHYLLDVDKLDDSELRDKIRDLNIDAGEGTRDEMINAIFEDQVEKHLEQPTFITDYPKQICPLTKIHRKDKDLVERFEAFVNGSELANAYSELNDPKDQEERLKKQEEARKKGDEEANPMDADFVRALEYGMPPTGGLGIGVDRLIMFLTNSQSIRDVILFPMMRSEK